MINSQLLFQEVFTGSSKVTITHNLGISELHIRVIVNEEVHDEYIQSVKSDVSDPENITHVYLDAIYSGRVQILQKNSTPQVKDIVNSVLVGTSVFDLDAFVSNVATIVLTEDSRINDPTNIKIGDRLLFSVEEDGSGPYQLNWGTLNLDISGVSGVINALGSTATLVLPVAIDLSNVKVGDFLGVSAATNNRNNQKGYIITAVDDASGTITYETRNGATTELGTYDITVVSGLICWLDGKRLWHSPQYKTVFELFYDGSFLYVKRLGVFPDKTQRSLMSNEISWWDDFFGTSVEGSMFDWTSTLGNNGTILAVGTIADENHPGTFRFRLAADAASRHTLRTEDNAFSLEGMRYSFETMRHQRQLVSVAEDCFYQVGIGNDANAGQHNFGVYFFYDLTSLNWQCKTAKGGTRTTYDTGIPVQEDVWERLCIESQNGAQDVVFKINGIEVARLTTNLPGVERLGVMLKGERFGAGSGTVDTIYDYVSWQYMLTGERDEY